MSVPGQVLKVFHKGTIWLQGFGVWGSRVKS